MTCTTSPGESELDCGVGWARHSEWAAAAIVSENKIRAVSFIAFGKADSLRPFENSKWRSPQPGPPPFDTASGKLSA